MQALRELLNENTRKAGRPVSRMPDHCDVSVDKSVKHIIIGWTEEYGTVKSAENEPPEIISPTRRCR